MGSVADYIDLSDTVVVIQHSDRVPLAYLTEFFSTNNIKYTVIQTYNNQLLPDTTNIYALIVLGGPQGAYETDKYLYLLDEIQYIKQCHTAQIPVLGLCLGAQLIAVALCSTAYHTAKYECGYVDEIATDAGMQDFIFSQLFDSTTRINSTLLMHHQDSYTVPDNVTVLATTVDNKYNAAFKCGNTYAIQSHPESGLNELTLWATFSLQNYASIGLTPEAVLDEAIQKQNAARKTTVLFFDTWWKFVNQCHSKQ